MARASSEALSLVRLIEQQGRTVVIWRRAAFALASVAGPALLASIL